MVGNTHDVQSQGCCTWKWAPSERHGLSNHKAQVTRRDWTCDLLGIMSFELMEECARTMLRGVTVRSRNGVIWTEGLGGCVVSRSLSESMICRHLQQCVNCLHWRMEKNPRERRNQGEGCRNSQESRPHFPSCWQKALTQSLVDPFQVLSAIWDGNGLVEEAGGICTIA